MTVEFEAHVVDKPFEMNFAQLAPSGPSIGCYQYVDPEVDRYMQRRWPKCLMLEGICRFPETATEVSVETVKSLLGFLLKLMLDPPGDPYARILTPDQRATVVGYRREFFALQMFDLEGNRRPRSVEAYFPTDIGEPVGPGLTSFAENRELTRVNELVWSQVLPFPRRGATVQDDLPAIRGKIAALRRHHNSYNELLDAHRHAQGADFKAAVRSAASAVDAILRFYCEEWGVAFPDGRMAFDQKIETVLQRAGKPSFRSVEAETLDTLLMLYRSRNAMHEGDCYYTDVSGTRIPVRSRSQIDTFIAAVESFVVWIDAVA